MRSKYDILHYGIPGMKWGVRKIRTKRTSHKQKVKSLTTKELREEIERMELEKRYSRLKSDEQSAKAIVRGSKLVGSILGNAAKKAITRQLASEMTKVLNSVIDKK